MKFNEIKSESQLLDFFKERNFVPSVHDKFLFQIDDSTNFLKIFLTDKIDKTTISETKRELKKIKNCHYGLITTKEFSKYNFSSTMGGQFTFSPNSQRSDTEASIIDKISKIKYSNDIYNQTLIELFDVKPIVSKFYVQYQDFRKKLIETIENLEADPSLYAQIILDRIIFLYFLQAKGIIPEDYLSKLYQDCVLKKKNFYKDYLRLLFFNLLNSESQDPKLKKTFGVVPFLNGGLFRKKSYEIEKIFIPNQIWEELFSLFKQYHWIISEDKGGLDSLTPEILGHIFEKTVNQKRAGAYYTPSQLTSYIAENTVTRLILERFSEKFHAKKSTVQQIIDSKNIKYIEWLYKECLSKLKILDNACGSGAFLLAVSNILFEYYHNVLIFLKSEDKKYHKLVGENLNYFIKTKIITQNIHGVDIEEGGVEICKLRLWLSMVSELESKSKIKPLPNIDYNIMAGSSLIGYFKEENILYKNRKSKKTNHNQSNLDSFQGKGIVDVFRKIIQQKMDYKSTVNNEEADRKKIQLENELDLLREELNNQLWAEFENFNIKLDSSDKHQIKPFHWIIEFPEVFFEHNGFDVIIGNPPWEIWKPEKKDFFAQYDPGITKNIRGKKRDQRIKKILEKHPHLSTEWNQWENFVNRTSKYLRKSGRYPYCFETIQPLINEKISSDADLYKVFLERMYQLLCKDGRCGVVLPSSFNTTLGSCGIRQMIFDNTKIDQLIDFENRYGIFDIHRGKHFLVITFKNGSKTENFPATFSVLYVEYLKHLKDISFELSWSKIKNRSPRSYAIISISDKLDFSILEKIYQNPLLGDYKKNSWNIEFIREIDLKNQANLYRVSPKTNLPLFRGEMIHQYTARWLPNKDWILVNQATTHCTERAISRLKSAMTDKIKSTTQTKNASTILKKILKREVTNEDVLLDKNYYRIGYRGLSKNDNERGLVSHIIPKNMFCGNSLILTIPTRIEIDDMHSLPKDLKNLYQTNYNLKELCVIEGLFNSFVLDYVLRKKILENVNMFIMNDLPVPRLIEGDKFFNELVERVAILTCQDEEYYSELAKELKIDVKKLSDKERICIRSEIESLVAKIYDLTYAQLEFILNTFSKDKDEFDFLSLSKQNKTKIKFNDFKKLILSNFQKLN